MSTNCLRKDHLRGTFHSSVLVTRRCLCGLWVAVFFLLIALWPELGTLFRSNQSAGASSSIYGPVTIDSFSQPGLAFGVLKQEGERLLVQCGETQSTGQSLNGKTATPSAICSNFCSASSNLSALVQLKSQAQDLNIDLGRKLMGIYFGREEWTKFLDYYLELLREDPKAAELWAGQALFASERCGRTKEIEQAFLQVTRFNRDPATISNLTAVTSEWRAENAASRPP